MIASFPDSSAGVSVSIAQVSEEADLAVVKGDLAALKRPPLKTDARKEAAVSGEPLISLGYATGINAMLARAGEEAVDQIAKATGGDADRVVNELVRRKLVRPLIAASFRASVFRGGRLRAARSPFTTARSASSETCAMLTLTPADESGKYAIISPIPGSSPWLRTLPSSSFFHQGCTTRSEERRVGKECRSRWSPYH